MIFSLDLQMHHPRCVIYTHNCSYYLFKGLNYRVLYTVLYCTVAFVCFIEMWCRRKTEIRWTHHVLMKRYYFESRRGISNLSKQKEG